MKHSLHRKALLLMTLASLATAPAHAAGPSEASANSSLALSLVTGSIVVGTAAALSATGGFVVEGIEKMGDSVVVTLKGVSEGVTVSVRTTAASVGNVSLGVGTAVVAVADASGHALVVSGKVIAYIPNEIGKSLIHSKKSVEREVRI